MTRRVSNARVVAAVSDRRIQVYKPMFDAQRASLQRYSILCLLVRVPRIRCSRALRAVPRYLTRYLDLPRLRPRAVTDLAPERE